MPPFSASPLLSSSASAPAHMEIWWTPGGVNVALPTNITAEDVAKVINEAELVGMACSVDELATLAPVLGACRTLRTFIVMDHEGNPSPHLPALVKQASPGWRRYIPCLQSRAASKMIAQHA